ncbi:hypothetical protein RKD32_003128 [Streptomyces sp. SAI-195]
MPADIWIGDLVKALALLDPGDSEGRRRVLSLLGFEEAGAVARTPAATEPASPLPRRAPQTSGVHLPTLPALGRRTAVPDDPAAGREEDGLAPGLRQLTPVAYESLPEVEWPVDSLPSPSAGRHDEPLPYEPLFAPRSTSAILQIALSAQTLDGEPDIPETVRRLAMGFPLTQLLVQPLRTLRFGVQVLVDVGVGMEPFTRDQHELIRQIRDIVGQELTDVRYFEGSPLRGTGHGDGGDWTEYQPPARGTRVLVLSDLGLGGPALHVRRAGAPEWREWIRVLESARCTAVAFVPYPPARWPAWARGLLHLVAWDRRTTAGGVRRGAPPRAMRATASGGGGPGSNGVHQP